jgi:hypothetical protein
VVELHGFGSQRFPNLQLHQDGLAWMRRRVVFRCAGGHGVIYA